MRHLLAARHTRVTLFICVVLGAVTAVAGRTVLPVPGASDDAGVPLSITAATVIPLAFAAVIAFGQRTRVPSLERLSSRPAWAWRSAHAILAYGAGAVIVYASAHWQAEPFSAGVVLRNFLALAVLANVTSIVATPTYAWMGPTLVTVLFTSALGGVSWNPLMNTQSDATILAALGASLVVSCCVSALRV